MAAPVQSNGQTQPGSTWGFAPNSLITLNNAGGDVQPIAQAGPRDNRVSIQMNTGGFR